MTVWDRSNTARRGARVATGQSARRQALVDDVENFLLASRSLFARLLSPGRGDAAFAGTPPTSLDTSLDAAQRARVLEGGFE
jgi:hypothetical protein